MKKIFLGILILSFFVSCQKNSENNERIKDAAADSGTVETELIYPSEDLYDAVIVGGGLTGLSAAYHLQKELGENAKILLLEKENRLGGKVFTKKFENITYEMGAIFGDKEIQTPKEFPDMQVFLETKRYGVFVNNNLYLGSTMRETLQSINSSNSKFFEDYDKNGNIDTLLSSVSEDVRKSMLSAFYVIHSGNFNEYTSESKKAIFYTFDVEHYQSGNSVIVDNYKKYLTGKYILGAEVKSVINQDETVSVEYVKNGKTGKVNAKSVVVATPATVSRKIIKNMKPESEKFLNSIKYGKVMFVIFVVKKDNPFDFSYIVTPDKSFNTVYFTRTLDKTKQIIHLVFRYDFIDAHNDWRNEDYIKVGYKDLQSMKIIDLDKDLLHSDSIFWKEVDVVISNDSYGNFSSNSLSPISGVFLAGDYTFYKDSDSSGMASRLPIGLPSAYFSGQFAAQKVLKYLKK